jgi:hypothetical protein
MEHAVPTTPLPRTPPSPHARRSTTSRWPGCPPLCRRCRCACCRWTPRSPTPTSSPGAST